MTVTSIPSSDTHGKKPAGRFYTEAMSQVGQGYPVFPCRGKVPAIPESEGGKGCADATTDEATIKAWAAKFPNANVGITFRPDSADVGMDVDVDNFPWLERIQREHGILETKAVRTGSGGLHYYWKRPAATTLPNVPKTAKRGYELKSNNMYLMAPGSIHPDTHKPYEIVMDIDPQPMPEWLLADVMAYAAGTEPSGNGHRPDKLHIYEGEGRNQALTAEAGRLLAIYKHPEIVKQLVWAYNEAVCVPPLTAEENAKTWEKSLTKWAAKQAPKKPEPAPKPEPKTWSVDELLDSNLPELTFRVQELIPDESLIVIAGRKKLGKSFLGLQLGTSVASGGEFLGKKCTRGAVLLLALEDGERRLRGRLRQQKTPRGIPLRFKFEMEPFDKEDGGLTQLKKWIEDLKPCLVIVDTLAKALSHKLDQNSAGETAEIVNALHALTVQYHLSIILIAHHGKMSYGDPGMDVRGSSAIPGATDGNFGLYRDGDDYYFKGESRDIEEFNLKVYLDKEETWCWQLLGDTKQVLQQMAEKAVLDALAVLGEADVSQIASEAGLTGSTVRARCKSMREAGLLSFRKDKKKLLYKANSSKPSTTPTEPTGYTTPTTPTIHNASVGLVGLFGHCPGCSSDNDWSKRPDGTVYCTNCGRDSG